MKTLYIVRHAKSSWKFPELADIERPLNKRGKRDAPVMAEFISGKIECPDVFLSSPSRRTYDTAAEFVSRFDRDHSELHISHDLYHASSNTWKNVIKEIPNHATSAMLFGHNPGVTDFVNELTHKNIYNIPTCGIAGIELDISSWNEVSETRGQLAFYYYPKGLFL